MCLGFFSCGEKRENQKEIEEMSLMEKKHGGMVKDENKDEVGEVGWWGGRAGGTGRLLQCCATLIYVYS